MTNNKKNILYTIGFALLFTVFLIAIALCISSFNRGINVKADEMVESQYYDKTVTINADGLKNYNGDCNIIINTQFTWNNTWYYSIGIVCTTNPPDTYFGGDYYYEIKCYSAFDGGGNGIFVWTPTATGSQSPFYFTNTGIAAYSRDTSFTGTSDDILTLVFSNFLIAKNNENVIKAGTYSLKYPVSSTGSAYFAYPTGYFWNANGEKADIGAIYTSNNQIVVGDTVLVDFTNTPYEYLQSTYSELVVFQDDCFCNYGFYQFFTKYFEVAPTILSGGYTFVQNPLISSNPSTQNVCAIIPFSITAEREYNYINVSTEYDQIRFGLGASSFPKYSDPYIAYYADGVWLYGTLERSFYVEENTQVSTRFYNWFVRNTENYYYLFGNYSLNTSLPIQNVDNSSFFVFGGSFTCYIGDNENTFAYCDNIIITSTSIKYNVVAYSNNLYTPGEVIVYSLAENWINPSYRFLTFNDLQVSYQLYDWIINNSKNVINWIENGNYFDIGYDSGYEEGKKEGFDSGYEKGKEEGEQIGFNRGVDVGSNDNFGSMLLAVVTAPFNMVQQFFNFDILGYNMSNFLFSLLSLCVVIAVVKFLI